jgi:hypothetical protein
LRKWVAPFLLQPAVITCCLAYLWLYHLQNIHEQIKASMTWGAVLPHGGHWTNHISDTFIPKTLRRCALARPFTQLILSMLKHVHCSNTELWCRKCGSCHLIDIEPLGYSKLADNS